MVDVLVVEDNPSVREGLCQTLNAAESGMRVLGAFGTAGEALRFIEGKQPPACALVDLHLPDRPGTTVIEALRERWPKCVSLVFTMFDDDDHVFPALQAGAQGYLLKDTSSADILRHIRDAVSGGAPMTGSIAARVVRRFWTARGESSEALTARERELLLHLCSGASYDNAAARMEVSLSTVQAHIRSIYRKLGVNSKAEAVSAAIRMRIFIP